MIGNTLRSALACLTLCAGMASGQEVAQIEVDCGDAPLWAGTVREVTIEFALPVEVIEEQLISVFRRPLDLAVRLETRAWAEQQGLSFEPVRAEASDGISFVWDGQLARAQDEAFEVDGMPWRRFVVQGRLRVASELETDTTLSLPAARLHLTYATAWEMDFLGERVPVNQQEWVGEAEVPALALRALPETPRASQSSGVMGPARLRVERSSGALQRGEEFQMHVVVTGEDLAEPLQVIAPEGKAWAWLGSIREDDGTRSSKEQRYRFDGRLMEAGSWAMPPFELLRFDPEQGAYVLEQSESQDLVIAGAAIDPPAEGDPRAGEAEVDPTKDAAAVSQPLPAWIPLLLVAGLLALAAWARQTMRQNVTTRESQAFERIERAAAAQEQAIEPLQIWLAARLNWPRARLSGPGTARRLQQAGIEAALAEQTAAFLQEAEAVRYGGPALADAAPRRETLRCALDAATKTLAS